MDAALAAWHEKFVYDTCPLWDVDALAEKNDEMVQWTVRVVESVVRQGGFEELAWTIKPLYAKQDYQSNDK
ncbi:hypothetical protein KIN20_037332 [Parelaphostrongylus tenuis]|uniref:Uncharacterized protein n=1 Tax=Parelaphostrongylus tenuis TaxID=148309 RepID=A0AAD5WM11_PARTN|nr:hypothetical protein KIN20_037332 [Parelaphostrongylus tenuis]